MKEPGVANFMRRASAIFFYFFTHCESSSERMRRTLFNPSEIFLRKDARRREKSSRDDSESSKSSSISRFDSSESSFGDEKRVRRRRTLARASGPEILVVKAELEASLPKLDPGRVRRFRIPHYDAVILELKEEGLGNAADYVKNLLELDEQMAREEAATGSAEISKKTRLKGAKSVLQRLVDGLRAAEIAERMGNSAQQASALTQTAIYFESKNREYFWIAERLYETCLAIPIHLQEDQPQIFAAVRFLYGKFLFEKMANSEAALAQLNKVRSAAKGKRWKIPEVFGLLRGTIYDEACVLSHRVLLLLSRRERPQDAEFAIRAAEQALERANDSFDEKGIALALYELGKSQASAGRLEEALRSFSKLLAIAKRIPDVEAICDAHMELAFAHKELGDSDGTFRHLESLRKFAASYDLPYKLAQAHYYIGEYLLKKGEPDSASSYLELALQEFRSLGKNSEAERARCTAGISQGQKVLASYVDLISNRHPGDPDAMAKLCDWKIKRVPFWWSSRRPEDSSDVEDPKPETSSLSSVEMIK